MNLTKALKKIFSREREKKDPNKLSVAVGRDWSIVMAVIILGVASISLGTYFLYINIISTAEREVAEEERRRSAFNEEQLGDTIREYRARGETYEALEQNPPRITDPWVEGS